MEVDILYFTNIKLRLIYAFSEVEGYISSKSLT